MEVDQEFRELINYQQYQQWTYYVVDNLLDIPVNDGDPQLLLRYEGLGDEDPAWISLPDMHEDVPELVSVILQRVLENATPWQKDLVQKH